METKSSIPLPPPLPIYINTPGHASENKNCRVDSSFLCKWASNDSELHDSCVRNEICLLEAPYKYSYRKFCSILQDGPTCGLVALSMLMNGDPSPEKLLNMAKSLHISNVGEMFSSVGMLTLAKTIMGPSVKVSIENNGLANKKIIETLLNGSVLLVPYDADFNHSPCLKLGHKAHWVLITGVIVVNERMDKYQDLSDVYTIGRHGKSRHVAIWKLTDLDKSNANLWEVSPKRESDELSYVLPEGGLSGEYGLRQRFLLIENI